MHNFMVLLFIASVHPVHAMNAEQRQRDDQADVLEPQARL